jgi:hypothetical protein
MKGEGTRVVGEWVAVVVVADGGSGWGGEEWEGGWEELVDV